MKKKIISALLCIVMVIGSTLSMSSCLYMIGTLGALVDGALQEPQDGGSQDGDQSGGDSSGGNVQKVLLGREISSSPTLLMAAYPVRGLDINSSYLIYDLLNDQKKKGVAVIFVGEDLDVLLDLCDRIMVVGGGRVTGILDGRNTTKSEIGYLMTKTDGKEDDGGDRK